MKPQAEQNPVSPNLLQDITAPQPKAPSSELIKTEIEHQIPVRQPGQTKAASVNPIASVKQHNEVNQGKNDVELDNILKEVNQNVKVGDKKSEEKRDNALKKKIFPGRHRSEAKLNSRKPILITLTAILVTSGLLVSAVYAFKSADSSQAGPQSTSSAGKVGTRVESSDAVQAAGGTLVTPSDLSNLSSLLNSELSKLNDTEEFNSKDLSDQNLGL